MKYTTSNIEYRNIVIRILNVLQLGSLYYDATMLLDLYFYVYVL